MTKLERVHFLLDELTDAIQQACGDYTRASINVSPDGYRSFTVEDWDELKLPIEQVKRRIVFDQHRCWDDDEWSEDSSGIMNSYYEKTGLLLTREG